ncbi:hypothetical protein [Lentzea fradiae]|uniref:hypothetical protein n=1 Tax=Lentzea fradiae TaxID=200378 RepID=UPI00115FF8F6|nr:hypothetical protein [Lentzea fradiae]
MTVPPGLRPQPHERHGDFETIEVQAPVTRVPAGQVPQGHAPGGQVPLGQATAGQVPGSQAPTTRVPVARPAAMPVEVAGEQEERSDMAVIGPIAAIVLALTISTLVLDHPAARAVAAALATVGLIAAVVIMMMGKKPGRHVARHAVDPEATDRIAPGWAATDPRR